MVKFIPLLLLLSSCGDGTTVDPAVGTNLMIPVLVVGVAMVASFVLANREVA